MFNRILSFLLIFNLIFINGSVLANALPKIIIRLGEKKLYLMEGSNIVKTFSVVVGKKNTETPIGSWTITVKQENPWWENFKTGKIVPPGKNPLGSRWIEFYQDFKGAIGIHQKPNGYKLGTASSNGCVSLNKKELEEIYEQVSVGDTVLVLD